MGGQEITTRKIDTNCFCKEKATKADFEFGCQEQLLVQ